MPYSTAPRAKTRLPLCKLAALTAAVTLAHIILLGGAPSGIGFISGPAEAPKAVAAVASFVTRSLAPETVITAPVVPKPRPAPAREAEVTARPANPATELSDAGSPHAEKVEPDTAAIATAKIDPVPPEPAQASSPSPLAPATAAAAAAEVQQAKKVKFADPVLLQFDGLGEQDGYKKYVASAELLWQPQAMQYSARLEMTFFGFRLRTWTSKGELTDGGLQPMRFGDKPRGAEQATHFQRDKGIISFSANNPDVPLQAGAQDKLTALLQLSAMVAGEPALYPAGAVISFQAADAHRAELWNFKAGVTEALSLPGGTLSTMKFTKEPTVEFDQRIEVWLATTMQHLPVRIRITEANGSYADLVWRKTLKPD